MLCDCVCVEREGIGKTIEKNGEATIQARQTGGRRTEGGRCNQARTVKAEGGRERERGTKKKRGLRARLGKRSGEGELETRTTKEKKKEPLPFFVRAPIDLVRLKKPWRGSWFFALGRN